MKRVLTVQDISCIGKCSITVALPIISAMGIETAILPTALLSNHTAFKSGYTLCNLTAETVEIINKLKKDNIRFNTIYTGYLGSIKQTQLTRALLENYSGTETLRMVDPAMADNGLLYPGFGPEYVKEITRLCECADIIIPNVTEACLMTHTRFRSDFICTDIVQIAKKLAVKETKYVLISGVRNGKQKIGSILYDRQKDTVKEFYHKYYSDTFCGAGDVFASCLAGALTRGFDIEEGIKIATTFLLEAIEKTVNDPDRNWNGKHMGDGENMWYAVNFEYALPKLINLVFT